MAPRTPVAPPRARPRPRPSPAPRARGVETRARRAPVKRAPVRRAPRTGEPSRRLALCTTILVVVFAVLAARVAQLQLFSGEKYKQLALASALHTETVSAERGSIFDRNGRDLAMSIERSTIYADPTLVDDPVGEAAKLAQVVHVDQQTLLTRLSDRGTADHPNHFSYIARTVPDDVAQAVTDMQLPGIGFVPESSRSYPAGAVAGDVVGSVHTDGTGADGIEYLYNALLTGKAGKMVVEQDPKGHDIPNTAKTKIHAQRGTDVALSIDEDLQWQAEYSLLDQVRATGANGGMAVVMDVTTGDVLAMASVHGATPKDPAAVAKPGDHNAPLTDLFEPGSTNKLITLSWAIEHGHVTPATKFNVPYAIKVDPSMKAPYVDAEPHYGTSNGIEHWTTADILRESSNVGTIMIAERMKNQELADGLHAFGLGQPTPIAWPGQPAGLLIPPSHYYATGKYSSAIGYGVAVTGMQMLDAFTTIANGGESRPPRLLDATIDARGKRHEIPASPGARVVSPATAATMTGMLQGVVAGGTGACAAIPGYSVAGKTGTAKKAVNGGYTSAATMASFIGFAPADHPRFATLVVLDENNLRYGGAVAAPVFQEIMQFALQQYGVAPNDTADAQYNQAHQTAQAAGNTCVVPHGAAVHPPAPPSSGQATTTGSPPTTDSLPADSTKQSGP